MKTIEWTRTGGNTHRVVITTGELIDVHETMWPTNRTLKRSEMDTMARNQMDYWGQTPPIEGRSK